MIAEMIQRSPFFSENVKAGKSELVFTLTGSKLSALAADAAGNAGANHLTASHTEAWGILYEAGVRIWEELTPPPGRSFGLPALRIANSYAGFTGKSKTWHKLIDRALAGERLAGKWPIFRAGGLICFHMEGEEAPGTMLQGRRSRTGNLLHRTAGKPEGERVCPDALQPADQRRISLRNRGTMANLLQPGHSPSFAPGEKVRLVLGTGHRCRTHDFTALVGMDGQDNLSKLFEAAQGCGIRFGKPTIDLEATIGAEVLSHAQSRASCLRSI